MTKQLWVGAASAAALMLSCAGTAQAATQLYTLNIVDSGAGVGAGPFGTVSVTENLGALDFLVTVNSPYRIHDGNANHNAFAFELNGDPAISISNLTTGFAFLPGTGFSAPPFGNNIWDYAIDCTTACGPGYGGGYAGPLSFTVTANSGSLSLASLGFNTATVNGTSSNIYFVADLVNPQGSTGNIGATLTGTAVPEPATWAMLIMGFGMAGAALRSRRRTSVAA